LAYHPRPRCQTPDNKTVYNFLPELGIEKNISLKEKQELVLSLKIVKKIVDIYDETFSLSTEIDLDSPIENYYRTTVKLALPLA
jgi:hypothetical protein